MENKKGESKKEIVMNHIPEYIIDKYFEEKVDPKNKTQTEARKIVKDHLDECSYCQGYYKSLLLFHAL